MEDNWIAPFSWLTVEESYQAQTDEIEYSWTSNHIDSSASLISNSVYATFDHNIEQFGDQGQYVFPSNPAYFPAVLGPRWWKATVSSKAVAPHLTACVQRTSRSDLRHAWIQSGIVCPHEGSSETFVRSEGDQANMSTVPTQTRSQAGPIAARKPVRRRTNPLALCPRPQLIVQLQHKLDLLRNRILSLRVHCSGCNSDTNMENQKERNRLASRVCRLKKKLGVEGNIIKVVALRDEYESLKVLKDILKGSIRSYMQSRLEDFPDAESRLDTFLSRSVRLRNTFRIAADTEEFLQNVLNMVRMGHDWTKLLPSRQISPSRSPF